MRENLLFEPRSLSYRVSRCMDTEVSPSRPESWRCCLLEEAFSEATTTDARLRDFGTTLQHRSSPHGNGYSSEIRCKRSNGEVERTNREQASEKASVVSKSILEGERVLVTGILRFNGRCRRGKDIEIRAMATTPGFRSNGV